jgi:tellurite resistance protein
MAGLALLALTSVAIVGLLLATLRGLRDGSRLAPEPAAASAS